MNFAQRIAQVEQAERALQAHAARAGDDWRQLKTDWRAAWTPGRILIAGALAGFLVGRAQPLRLAGSRDALQLLTALAGLFAGAGQGPGNSGETSAPGVQAAEEAAAAEATT